MRISTARNRAVVAAPVVAILLSACSAGPSSAETEACNAVLAWQTGGQDPEWFDRSVATAEDALGDAEDSTLAELLARLTASPEDERTADVEAFMASCEALGWELPEG